MVNLWQGIEKLHHISEAVYCLDVVFHWSSTSNLHIFCVWRYGTGKIGRLAVVANAHNGGALAPERF